MIVGLPDTKEVRSSKNAFPAEVRPYPKAAIDSLI
jgi:hypothetical protein